MATALDMITRAMRLIKVYGTGENVGDDEARDGLVSLNAMLDEWANEHLMLYAATLNAIALTPALASYTIGPSGSTITARPVSIDPGTYLDIGGISYPLEIATLDQYNSVVLKALTTSIPQYIFYNPTFPNATVTLYPVPTTTATLNLWTWKPLTTFSTLTQILTLPPGYENAIVYNLAEYLAPEFDGDIHISVHSRAVSAKKKLKRTNFTPMFLEIPVSVPRRFNIYSGQ